MLIIGCDYHPGFQQIAFVDTETGELGERRLSHREDAERFYNKLKEQSLQVRVGMEASGPRAGSSVFWASGSSSCGSGMQLRSAPSGCAGRRRIGRMRSCCCVF